MVMSPRKVNILLVILTLIVAGVLVLHNFQQARHAEYINESWNDKSLEAMQTAMDLAAVERSFGYLGFIHHFKNYVLRRDEVYFREATKAYWVTNDALVRLILSDLPERDVRDLIQVQRTLNEYFRKLNDAYTHYAELSAKKLDAIVRVDDLAARDALSRLRIDIIPNLNEHYQVASQSNARYEQWTLLSITIPFMIIFGFAIVISVVSRKVLMRAREIDVIFQASPDAFIYSDSKGNILRSNQMASDIFGYSALELKKLKIEDLVEPTKQEYHENLRETFVKQGGRRMMGGRNTEIKGVTKSGKRVPLSIAISSFSFEEHQGSIAIIRDITDFKRLESDSMHDALTGVYNRRHIEERFEDEVKRAKRYARALSLLVVDLDNFKNLNDTEGHRAGDNGLVVAAEHLRSQLRKHDHIGRWGGDEFVVICPELDRADAIEIAERIRRRFEAQQFPWCHKMTMSIGVASLSPDTSVMTPRDLFEEADQALYLAKERGRNRVEHFFDLQRPKRVK